MEYREALEYLFGLINYEKTNIPYTDLKLERMREFMARLGNPERHLPTVLIAGTKGKGSTSYLLHRLFGGFRFRCGLYSKPHLFTFRERIRINDELITPKELANLVAEVRPVVERMGWESPWGKPTYFEASVGLAMLYFVERKVDVAVVEVGLGGRLDATNVTEPCVTVITPISFDHMEVLGNTLTAIAREKAGILRPSVPLVLAPQEDEARRTILEEAQKKGAPVFEVAHLARVEIRERSREGSRFSFSIPQWGEGEVGLPLLGDHQVTNALSALFALSLFDLPFDLSRVREAFTSFSFRGRVDVLLQNPLVVFDVAHNQASFRALRRALQEYLGVEKAIYLLGFLEGKDCAGIAQELQGAAAHLVLTEPLHPKALPAVRALTYFEAFPVPKEVVPDACRAKERALALAESLGLPLVVAGSFYLARPFQEEFRVRDVLEEEVELC
ncbi:MAG: bifunctional folylpolyglutamate synthase/dihydrofolate synthase [Candidatus Caldatribacterium sp.]|uniref:bifunctional folylpolyglutamate synthase/dihydrofolate synthase n=1 Tax=Candidatus Caldatribacterium sp. TaxID=2282143 RepID=UPI0029977FAC|nr:bifunctional folylpolyglutamate synthase/dihydrofolate synthase [Candidatus Caldatribacterium sp.]MCX7729654.1 bifunctional folylpolyglutamate synthase/dihydrofolate synthase [Candidatus Caldatribacterium sp.]MDW8081683.1 folylpolyglutamate synthase/dihydrofolate synthase family protein [Candidatus Calescibacterium sp.]